MAQHVRVIHPQRIPRRDGQGVVATILDPGRYSSLSPRHPGQAAGGRSHSMITELWPLSYATLAGSPMLQRRHLSMTSTGAGALSRSSGRVIRG